MMARIMSKAKQRQKNVQLAKNIEETKTEKKIQENVPPWANALTKTNNSAKENNPEKANVKFSKIPVPLEKVSPSNFEW